jgi:hypothetical protein
MDIQEFLNIVKSNKKINFFSMNQNFYSIGNELIIKSHPHDNRDNVETEFKSLFKFVSPIFIYQDKLSSRPKMQDIFIGFLYSNTENTTKFIKQYN